MTRRLLLVALGAAACLPKTDDPAEIVECESTSDCNAAAGEVCDLGVCWGDPPEGAFSAVVAPPLELRGALVKTAIPELTMERDGTLGNGAGLALFLDAGVTVRGHVSIPCPPTVAGCSGRYPLAGTLRLWQAPAFPGGPKLVESDDVGADGDFAVVVARPTANDARTFGMSFTPALTATRPGDPIAASFLAPIASEVTFSVDDIDADTGEIRLDIAADPATQRKLTGRITAPGRDGVLAGWRVTAEMVTNPALGSRTLVSTVADTNATGAFTLRVPEDVTIVDVLVVPPVAADADHAPSLRVRDAVVTGNLPVLDYPLLGVAVPRAIDVTGIDSSGGTVAVDGAAVTVRLTHALAGNQELVLETRTTTVGGRASLPLYVSANAAQLTYDVDVTPPAGESLGARYGEPLTPATSGLALALPQRIPLVGRIKDDAGHPVEGATVIATVSVASLCSLSSETSRLVLGQAPAQVTTNKKGEYALFVDGEIADVPLTYDLSVRPPAGDGHPEWTFAELDPHGGGDLHLPDAAHVRGLVLAEGHGPVMDAALTVYEWIDGTPTCVSALGTAGAAVVRGRGEADDTGTAAVVLPRPTR